jgi:hypothetical protein
MLEFNPVEKLKSKIEQIDKNSVKKWLGIYIQEVFEAFIAILIIRIAVDKSVDFYKIILVSLVIGFVTMILENYNSTFNSNIKQGITFTAGSQMISGFLDN